MTFLLRVSGRKILFIIAENAAGPMEIPGEKSIKFVFLISNNELC